MCGPSPKMSGVLGHVTITFFPQIIPTGEEIVPAVIHFAQYLLSTPIPFTPKDAVTQDNEYTVLFPYQYSPEYSS